MTNSTRERAMQALKTLFENQVQGVAPDSYDFAWSKVQRAPLGDAGPMKAYSLAILELREVKNPQIHCYVCTLSISLEFNLMADSSEEAATMANLVLTNIQRKLRQDVTLGGIVLDVNETGNEIDVDSLIDRQIVGAVFVDILYRHGINDPRAYPGTGPPQ